MAGQIVSKELTLEERLKVACLHSLTKWTVDRTHGHGVCYLCGKPSSELVLRKCSVCENEFVLNFGPDWESKYFLVGNKVFEREFFCSKKCYYN